MNRARATWALVLALPLSLALSSPGVPSAAPPDGTEVARRVNARDEGGASRRRVRMELRSKTGSTRVREAVFYRRLFGAEKRTAIFYESPPTLRGTAFLTYDHPEPGRDDDQWLYLPALRRTRRISASDRGGYFLGTDLTYEDIKNETRVSLSDYHWKLLGSGDVDGHPCWRLEALPVNDATAEELGYSRVESWVDPEIWMVRRAEYWDMAGRHLKTSWVSEISLVTGIWTPHRIEVTNHRTGHQTVFRISDVEYETPLDEAIFTERALRRGPPRWEEKP